MDDNNEDYIGNPFFSRGFKYSLNESKPWESFRKSCCKLDSFDWLRDISQVKAPDNTILVEVRFKNSKKEIYRAPAEFNLREGDIVAVETNAGHDIGVVSMTGELVRLQLRKKKNQYRSSEPKMVYRRARISDIEKWISAIDMEEDIKKRSKKIISDLNLNMKLNDVEVQGDSTKAYFYYTADERVDFRELIKILAERFRLRIEMKQIGARQESSQIGGLGTCGRELCCSSWLTRFRSVSTNNARTQQLTLNPQKLAGQCGKLKCCLNYENEVYAEALKNFPSQDLVLESKKGRAFFQKADVFGNIMWYSYEHDQSSMMAISLEKIKEVIGLNRKGVKPEQLEDFAEVKEQKTAFVYNQENEDLTRFDKEEKKEIKKQRH